MDCPDCGSAMVVVKQETRGNDIVYVIETWYECPQCDQKVETERAHDER